MFRSKTRTERAKEQVAAAGSDAGTRAVQVASQLRDQVGVLREKVGPAAEAAIDWATPKVESAREWAAPRLEKGLEAAGPRVEAAAEAMAPKVDAARDKIVEELLPRIVDAVNAAAAEAKVRGGDAAAVIKGDAVAAPKRSGKKRFLLIAVISGAIFAGWRAWKRSTDVEPWTPAPYPAPVPPPPSPAASVPPTGGVEPATAVPDAQAEQAADDAKEADAEGPAAEGSAAEGSAAEGAGAGKGKAGPGKATDDDASRRGKHSD